MIVANANSKTDASYHCNENDISKTQVLETMPADEDENDRRNNNWEGPDG